MLYMFCANGLEEVEALGALDVIRRAGIEVKTVGIDGKTAKGPHNIEFFVDIELQDFDPYGEYDGVILPGGGVGTETLYKTEKVKRALFECAENKKLMCAICAAPSVLGRFGLLEGKEATCYPGFEKYLTGAEVCNASVVRSGNVITSRGMGCAIQFGLNIVAYVSGIEKANEIAESIQFGQFYPAVESKKEEDYFKEAVKVGFECGKVTSSLLQRKLQIGFGLAARLVDKMEKLGICSAYDKTKRYRTVLITPQEFEEIYGKPVE